MAKSELKLKISVMDCEPVNELVILITEFPRDELPDKLREGLEKWCDKYTTDAD